MDIYSYKCSCGLINSLLNSHCADRKCRELNQISLTEIDRFEIIHLHIYASYEERRLIKPMAESPAELHAKFFANEKIFIKDMSIEQKIDHLRDLESIILEARARASATDDDIRQTKAKLSKDERDRLISNPDYTGSDAISTISKRKDRISKADKMKDSFAGLGLDDAAIKALMSNIKVNTAGDGSNPPANSNKGFTFNKDNQAQAEARIDRENDKVTEITIPSTPFDPTNLFGS